MYLSSLPGRQASPGLPSTPATWCRHPPLPAFRLWALHRGPRGSHLLFLEPHHFSLSLSVVLESLFFEILSLRFPFPFRDSVICNFSETGENICLNSSSFFSLFLRDIPSGGLHIFIICSFRCSFLPHACPCLLYPLPGGKFCASFFLVVAHL